MATVVERMLFTPPQNCMHKAEASGPDKREQKYKVVEFKHPYTVHPCHPLTDQYTEDAYSWLESFDVDADVGPELWRALRSQGTPSLMGYVFADFDLEPRTRLWLFKLCGLIFALDTKVDESECGINVDHSCDVILDLSLILLWNFPKDERVLNHIKSVSQSITSDGAKGLLKRFEENLAHARNQTKSITDIQLVPLAASFREIWMEYCADVPSGFEMRLAYSVCEYLTGIMWEATNRKAKLHHVNIADYIPGRRLTSAAAPFIVCCDLFISRGKDLISPIPQNLLFSQNMRDLLDALSDILCWHNDVISFYKECVMGDDIHNLVKLITTEHNIATYTETGKMVFEFVYERIAEMERIYERLRSSASPEFHPAIDLAMKGCRNWVAGSHTWHSRSHRFPQVDGDALTAPVKLS